MMMQVRPVTGESFWDLSGIALEAEGHAQRDTPWVRWQCRTWLYKRKSVSICEVAGYQIAEALGLPLQPWAAFVGTAERSTITARSGTGLLVEHCGLGFCEARLDRPAARHPDLVGRALALAVLDRHEWPEWLVSGDEAQLRLFDLERIGPSLCWPLQRTRLRDYRRHTQASLSEAFSTAREAGVLEALEKHLEHLKKLDSSRILDFSGHPYADGIKKTIVHGLEARQFELRRILDGVRRPRRPTSSRGPNH